MRQAIRVISVLAAILVVSASGFAGQIFGDYVESRNADVYTGPCFANAEVGLAGDLATMAWKIRQGEWNGVKLDGLGVVAVAKANATLGDTYHNPYPAKAIIIVDQRASERQKNALVSFAQAMGGRLLENVVLVQSTPISMEVGDQDMHGSVLLTAGNLVKIETRSLNEKDHFCGNETTYYEPLTELSHAMPVYAIASEYQGNALGSVWRTFDKRSAFVGTFSKSELVRSPQTAE